MSILLFITPFEYGVISLQWTWIWILIAYLEEAKVKRVEKEKQNMVNNLCVANLASLLSFFWLVYTHNYHGEIGLHLFFKILQTRDKSYIMMDKECMGKDLTNYWCMSESLVLMILLLKAIFHLLMQFDMT